MKKHLQRILSLLCVLALALGCVCALAEDSSVQYDDRIITVKWSDGNNYAGIRPDHVDASLAGQKTTLNEENDWTGVVSVPSDTENDWNKDIDKLELSDNSKILLSANVENGIPADLEINITPVNKNGQPLTALTVTPIKNKIAAGATAGELQYEIYDASGKALKQLDGVDYRLKVTAPSDEAQKGKTLNKNQKIKIKDITVQLNGKVVYDAN